MLDTMLTSNNGQHRYMDLGHVAIFSGIGTFSQPTEQEQQLFGDVSA
jgi:hypothetical protein